ncbi:MAG: UDP-N-acetylmuramate--L-alanine ligase [PVC group bacterium]|nr:UDP-N-acetylmuramate--L-alanine ligase [PVC group bacterium]
MHKITKLIPPKRVHFIGIGGVGMSALAQILVTQGYHVSGSDLKRTKITSRLEALGAKIFYTHCAENVSDAELIVYSSCISNTNPEIILAKEKGIFLVRRAELLAWLMDTKIGIAISGAHGKTTTTAFIAYILKKSGLCPSYAVGADVEVLSGNAENGSGRYFVAEADESDGSFLCIYPEIAVITNIDKEHLDYYENLDHIISSYGQFAHNVSPTGLICCYGEDERIRKALEGYTGRIITYGLSNKCDVYAQDILYQEMDTEFVCSYQGKEIGVFKLQIPGAHNVLNALASIVVGLEVGLTPDSIRQALAEFHGVNRRFQIRYRIGKITIIDDYAHHPTEITATLKAAQGMNKSRIIGVFQPHRYSRTKFLKEEFGSCFSLADQVIITDIYAACETPIDGVAAKTIYEQVRKNGHENVQLIPRDKINKHLAAIAKEGDILMLLGAGDINALSDDLAQKISEINSGKKDEHHIQC